jgi:uncharacterized protein YoxC
METLQIIIYVLLIILIAVAIVIGIKLIGTLNKVDSLVDDVTNKVKTLDRVFDILDVFNNKMSELGDTVVGFVSGGIKRLFRDRKKKNDYEEEEED